MILQIFLYFFRRMVIRCFQCTHRRSQNFGHIFVFHFVEIAHIKNEALFLRKLQNRLLQKPLCAISVEIFVALYMREQEIIVSSAVRFRRSRSRARKVNASFTAIR